MNREDLKLVITPKGDEAPPLGPLLTLGQLKFILLLTMLIVLAGLVLGLFFGCHDGSSEVASYPIATRCVVFDKATQA